MARVAPYDKRSLLRHVVVAGEARLPALKARSKVVGAIDALEPASRAE